jgi:acyl-CoA thioesterase-1
MNLIRLVLPVLFAAALAASAAEKKSTAPKAAPKPKAKAPNPAYAPVEDVAGLPRVLLIGDSISIGYTLDVRKQLAGKANVHRIPENGGPTPNGLAKLDQWLGSKPWDVIHFNWGLHDLKYMGSDGSNLADPKASGSRQQVKVEDYERNLDTLVTRLQQTGAKLIWCATTPVPSGASGRIHGDEARYNAAALRVMKKHGVQVNDLAAWAAAGPAGSQLPANVHYTADGSAYLAKQVVASIEAALASRK